MMHAATKQMIYAGHPCDSAPIKDDICCKIIHVSFFPILFLGVLPFCL